MTTIHPTFEFVGGDDWEIEATLLDENGVAYNLSPPPQILWTLVNDDAVRIVDVGDYVVVIVNAAQGICKIQVPATKTTNIRQGLFTDSLRIVIGAVSSMLSMGPVYVTADPWRVASTYQFTPLRVVA